MLNSAQLHNTYVFFVKGHMWVISLPNGEVRTIPHIKVNTALESKCGGSSTPSKINDTNLHFVFVNNKLVYTILDREKSTVQLSW